jgi:Domain of unknown function (DUF397)
VDTNPTWRSSSRSGGSNNCVEIRGDLGAVRDSKNPNGPALVFAGVRFLVRLAKALR